MSVQHKAEDYDSQQVTAPKLLFLTDEKPTAISNEASSAKSSPTLKPPPDNQLQIIDTSLISNEPDATDLNLSMPSELAREFKKTAKLPGVSFLQSKPSSNETMCFISLHHSALDLLSDTNIITRTPTFAITQICNCTTNPSF